MGDFLRPIKDLIFEEYWNIAYRFCGKDESVFASQTKPFNVLPKSKRYWYADPFLFEHMGEIYLFVEMFDNKTEKGLIGVSKLCDEGFGKPDVVLEEDFHLSYPYVFEENGEIYMMPETMGDGCVQLYRAVSFPDKWEKHSVLVEEKGLVDTVICGDWLISSRVTNPAKKETQLQLYRKSTGEAHPTNGSVSADQITRGAGRIFEHEGRPIRPAQNCLNGVYGAGLIFYCIDELSDSEYKETKVFSLDPEQIKLIKGSPAQGVHTYARCGRVEIADVKNYRFNLKRLCWILGKYVGKFKR